MKIRVLRNLGAGLPDYHEGQTVDCPKAEADNLIDLGLAVAEVVESKVKGQGSSVSQSAETKPPKPDGKTETKKTGKTSKPDGKS